MAIAPTGAISADDKKSETVSLCSRRIFVLQKRSRIDAPRGLMVGIPDSLGPRRFARTKATLIGNCHAEWKLSFAKRSSAGVEAYLRSSQRLMRHEVQHPLNALFKIG